MSPKKSDKPSFERQLGRGAWWLTKKIGYVALNSALLTTTIVVNLFRDQKVDPKGVHVHHDEDSFDKPGVERVERISPLHRAQRALGKFARQMVESTPQETAQRRLAGRVKAINNHIDHSFADGLEGTTDPQNRIIIAARAVRHAGLADPRQSEQ